MAKRVKKADRARRMLKVLAPALKEATEERLQEAFNRRYKFLAIPPELLPEKMGDSYSAKARETDLGFECGVAFTLLCFFFRGS